MSGLIGLIRGVNYLSTTSTSDPACYQSKPTAWRVTLHVFNKTQVRTEVKYSQRDRRRLKATVRDDGLSDRGTVAGRSVPDRGQLGSFQGQSMVNQSLC